MKEEIRVGRYLIYGLLDPIDRSLRYIGKTHKRREWRLAEHIQCAKNGDPRVVYDWIRSLLAKGIEPEIFVLKKLSPSSDWRKAEKNEIRYWKQLGTENFPIVHPPQTPKSRSVTIHSVALLNRTDGG